MLVGSDQNPLQSFHLAMEMPSFDVLAHEAEPEAECSGGDHFRFGYLLVL